MFIFFRVLEKLRVLKKTHIRIPEETKSQKKPDASSTPSLFHFTSRHFLRQFFRSVDFISVGSKSFAFIIIIIMLRS